MSRLQIVLLSAVSLALGGCGSERDVLQESESFRAAANYFQAYKNLEALRAQHPGDERIEKAYWVARLDYLIDVGRDLVFSEQEVKALASLESALALDPENAEARFWIAYARRKLAADRVRQGDEARVTGQMDAAMLSYNEATAFVPGFPDALEGLGKVRAEFERRRDKARDHYTQGVRAQSEQNFDQTRYHMIEALRNDPDLELAKARGTAVGNRLAERRYELARTLEESAHYGAALKEYQAVAEDLPGLPDLAPRIAQMKLEVEAEQLVRDGEKRVFRGEFAAARAALDKAYELTIGQKKFISEMLVLVKEREFDQRYQLAKDLELEHKFAAAVTAYKELDQSWPGQKDIRARINDLESRIDLAQKAYEKGQEAEKAGDVRAAIEAYQDALLFHPGYRGLDHKVSELRVKL